MKSLAYLRRNNPTHRIKRQMPFPPDHSCCPALHLKPIVYRVIFTHVVLLYIQVDASNPGPTTTLASPADPHPRHTSFSC